MNAKNINEIFIYLVTFETHRVIFQQQATSPATLCVWLCMTCAGRHMDMKPLDSLDNKRDQAMSGKHMSGTGRSRVSGLGLHIGIFIVAADVLNSPCCNGVTRRVGNRWGWRGHSLLALGLLVNWGTRTVALSFVGTPAPCTRQSVNWHPHRQLAMTSPGGYIRFT